MRWRFWDRFDPEIQEPAYNPDNEPAPLGDVHRRGDAAHQLLNDPTLAEAFRALREDLYAEFIACDPTQIERLKQIHHEAHALNRITGKLIAYRAAARIRRDTAA